MCTVPSNTLAENKTGQDDVKPEIRPHKPRQRPHAVKQLAICSYLTVYIRYTYISISKACKGNKSYSWFSIKHNTHYSWM